MPPRWIVMILLTLPTRSSHAFQHVCSIISTRISISSPINHIGLYPKNHHLFSSSSSVESWEDPSISGYKRANINWYPGHIASAERQLSETLKAVDVVIEVRDARIPKATAHPKVREWAAGKPRIVVLTRVDMIPQSSIKYWKQTLQRQMGDNISPNYETSSEDRSTTKNSDGQSVHRALQAWNERRKYTNDTEEEEDSKIRTSSRILDQVEAILYVDAKHGQGIHAIHRHVLQAGQYVNARRISRGLNPRPLRVGILGYPNVGKSALINRILGQNRAKSADTPGITRQLRWVKVRGDDGAGNAVAYGASATDASGRSIAVTGTSSSKKRGEFELLDSPGIIPAHMVDQNDALLLAACNSIGQAAYDNQDVAAFFMERIKNLHLKQRQSLTAPSWRRKCIDRYGFDPMVPINDRRFSVSAHEYKPSSSLDIDGGGIRLPTGEDMIYMVAERKCQGDPETAARMILQDFRAGRLGPIVLQLPELDEDDARRSSNLDKERGAYRTNDNVEQERILDVSKLAKETAEIRGIKLPPRIVPSSTEGKMDELIGRGQFDGW